MRKISIDVIGESKTYGDLVMGGEYLIRVKPESDIEQVYVTKKTLTAIELRIQNHNSQVMYRYKWEECSDIIFRIIDVLNAVDKEEIDDLEGLCDEEE